MNTGLLLKRPGESPYSRYRRFMIANHGLYKTMPNIRKDLVEYLSLASPLGSVATFELIAKYERRKIQHFKPIFEQFPDKLTLNFRPKRHCQDCTETAFHSLLFELPWINICPLHHIPLTKRCDECGHELPFYSEFLTNNCTSCGSKISLSKIVERLASVKIDDFEKFSALSKVETVDTKLFPNINFLGSQGQITNRRLVNANSSFYPSVVQCLAKKGHTLKDGFRSGTIFKYSIATRHYQLTTKPKAELIRRFYSDSLVKLVDTLTTRIIRTLENETQGHRLGMCLSDSSSDKLVCTSCRAYHTWLKILPYNIKTTNIEEPNVLVKDDWQVKVRNIIGWSLFDIIEPIFYISLPNTIDLIKVPSLLTIKIFQLDLWTVFLSSYQVLKSIELAESESLNTKNGFSGYLRSLAQQQKTLFCPFYIRIHKNTLIMQYPKLLDKSKLNSFHLRLLRL